MSKCEKLNNQSIQINKQIQIKREIEKIVVCSEKWSNINSHIKR